MACEAQRRGTPLAMIDDRFALMRSLLRRGFATGMRFRNSEDLTERHN